LQCHAITGVHRFPTPAEIRTMTWISLGSGSRGVFWFLYQTEALDPGRKTIMSGLVDENYKTSDRWEEVAKLATQIKALTPVLADLTPAPDSAGLTCSQWARLLVDSKKRSYVLAVNLDRQRAQKVSLNLGPGSEIA